MANKTATALRAVQTQAENIRCDKPQRFPEAASPGDAIRQGDVYLTLLDQLPHGCQQVAPRAQVADGTTQGSRHVLDSLDGVTMYEMNADALQGPLLRLEQERALTHPEHGHWILPPGLYEVTYQRAMAEELRRVAD